MDHLRFYAEGPHVYMQDGPWAVRVDQQSADEFLALFERINAIKAHTSLYDACAAAKYIPTCSPIRRGPRLVSDNTALSTSERVHGMFEASRKLLAGDPGPEAA